MKDKVVIGPFTVAGGLDDAGAIREAAIIAPTATTEEIKIIFFKVNYAGEISEMDVTAYDELKANTVEDFSLEGKDFYFVCELDANDIIIRNKRNFDRFAKHHAVPGKDYKLSIKLIEEAQ